MHFYVYDSKGDQIVNEECNTGFGGVSRCWINSKDWEIGNYKLASYIGAMKMMIIPGQTKK